MQTSARWLTLVVVLSGTVLRIGLTAALPPESAYDDHFEPIRWILDHRALPVATDCWECYQPPLYYVVSAFTYAGTTQLAGTAEGGRKAIQYISTAAGIATLWVCVRVLRRTLRLPPGREALAVAVVAFLPQHVYMSAMATNDALTHLLAALAVQSALAAHRAGWPIRATLATGAWCGAAALCKGYGLMTALAVLGTLAYFLRCPRPRPLRPLVLAACAALAVGVWPYARNQWNFGRPIVDNYHVWQETPMRYQPPGSIGATSFFSLRFPALLAHPWLHRTHADSILTQLYARLWFDYEGFRTTLERYPPWQSLWQRAAAAHPTWNRARWDMLLDYAPDEVPLGFSRVAVVSYIAGVPLTAAVLAGLVLAARRAHRRFVRAVLVAQFLAALLVPLVQTLRLPHFAAMKAGFALSGVVAAPVFVALAVAALPRPLRRAVSGVLWLAVGALAAADGAYVILQYMG